MRVTVFTYPIALQHFVFDLHCMKINTVEMFVSGDSDNEDQEDTLHC